MVAVSRRKPDIRTLQAVKMGASDFLSDVMAKLIWELVCFCISCLVLSFVAHGAVYGYMQLLLLLLSGCYLLSWWSSAVCGLGGLPSCAGGQARSLGLSRSCSCSLNIF
jgi:hypothetical protein